MFVWGVEDYGNIVMKYDLAYLMGIFSDPSGQPTVLRKPIYKTGKYLLLKNPDDENGLGLAGDLSTSTVTVDGKPVHTVENTSSVSNKIAIDWDNPLGPALTFAGDLPIYSTGNDERSAFPYQITGDDENRPGIATEGEFCADCHDGTAGLSTQAAEVWKPSASDSTTGAYEIAYSHDSQPRGCDRQLLLNPGDENNFGPECRKCHVGASSCNQCHADPGVFDVPNPNPLEPVWDTAGSPPLTEGRSTYVAQPSLKSIYAEGVATALGPACMDGGFSFPHRTLGYNMLKDSLWGVDFDGTPLAPGEVRGAGMNMLTLEQKFGTNALAESFETSRLVNTAAENLDSACIDCHVPTVWNGGDPAYETSVTVHNYPYETGYRTDGSVPDWTIKGWDLLLKGLP
jgi:hypothetical protein